MLSARGQEAFKMAEQSKAEGEVASQQAREKSVPTPLSQESAAYKAMARLQEAKYADAIRQKFDIPPVQADNPARVLEASRGTIDAQVHE